MPTTACTCFAFCVRGEDVKGDVGFLIKRLIKAGAKVARVR